jgi:FliI/YscN family ATPase
MNTQLDTMKSLIVVGEIVSAQGSSILARIPQAAVGDLCWIDSREGVRKYGQIVSFNDNLFSIALFEDPDGICPGTQVRTRGTQPMIKVGPEMLGRIVNPLGLAIDEIEHEPRAVARSPLNNRPPPASGRPMIEEKMSTGVRVIDGFCTIGYGQRLGIFASAGVGKSTLLAMVARGAAVDVIVVALVGERSREVREFIEETLGADGLARSVLVVATSDDSSLMRQTAPFTATAIAEYFRDCGKRVLLIVDSLTRMARAIRETSLAAGEMPVRHGYTNSVYTQLPKLLERAGTSSRGSITAIYTVLTNQDEDIDPLADEIKSLLDGHLVLRKELATMGILPAIDITQSISRLFTKLHDPTYRKATQTVTHAMFRLLKERELVLLGGTPDPELECIIENQAQLFNLLSQSLRELCRQHESEEQVMELSRQLAQFRRCRTF